MSQRALLERAGFPVATFLLASFAASLSSAAVVVSDRFSDGDRTDPAAPVYSEFGVDADADGNIESAWYTSNAAGATVTPGTFSQVTVATGSTSWQTYFTPEATPVTLAAVGDTMQVKWVFRPQGVANDAVNNTGQNFRLAVVNSPAANRLTADGAPGNSAGPDDYFGYSMFMNMDQTLRRTTPFELRERAAVGAFLSASGSWSPGLADDGSTNDPGYVSGRDYTYTMTLTRTAAGLDIVSRMEGTGLGPSGQGFLQVAFSDPTPSSYSYDLFGVRPSAGNTTAAGFDTTLFEVTYTPIPEPGTLTLLGGAALLGLRRRRQ
jgi:hypothetical protein